MLRRIYIFCVVVVVSGIKPFQICAQKLSLQECIDYAVDNGFDIKDAELGIQLTEEDVKRSRYSAYPNLNLNYNIGLNNGRSIDPFTNSYINTGLTFSNLGVSTGITLFNGYRIKNSKKQARLNLQAAKAEVTQNKELIALAVTRAYLQVLSNQDQLNIIETRLETTENQLKRIKKLYDEGQGNPADYTDMQGQLHSDQTALEMAKNNLEISRVDLFEIMNYPSRDEVILEYPGDLTLLSEYAFSKEEIIQESFEQLSLFEAAKLRIQALDASIDVAKSGAYPSIDFFAQANTNYSSAAKTFREENTVINATGDFVEIDNRSFQVMSEETVFSENGISYPSQFSNNLNTAFGFSVRMPIFDRMDTKTNVAQQRILKEQAENLLDQTHIQIKSEIERAFNDLQSTLRQIKILEEQVAAYEKSYQINEFRYEQGVSNIVEYLVSKNNLESARLNLASARYAYFLRTKVLDFYRGS